MLLKAEEIIVEASKEPIIAIPVEGKLSHKSIFKGEICGNTFKKETTLRKYVNIKSQ